MLALVTPLSGPFWRRPPEGGRGLDPFAGQTRVGWARKAGPDFAQPGSWALILSTERYLFRRHPFLEVALHLPLLRVLFAQLLVLQLPVLHHALPAAPVLGQALATPGGR